MTSGPHRHEGLAELRSRLVATAGFDVGRRFDLAVRPGGTPPDRRTRQQRELAAVISDGDVDRALVLCREHLADFPDDVLVAGLERLLHEAPP